MTARERDERDASLFAVDALREARRIMPAPSDAPAGSYFMAVFCLLAVGALCPDLLDDRADADA